MFGKNTFIIAGIIFLTLLFTAAAGCIGSSQTDQNAVLKIATPNEITEASYFGNYKFAQKTRVATPPLVQVDVNGECTGALAKSRTVSSDGKI